MIAALAGRRIDALVAPVSRFPATHIERVERSIRERLLADGVSALVAAAACGSDLLALSAAAGLGIRRRIVLPFAAATFKERSVIDRPSFYPWGDLYDAFVREVEATDDLCILDLDPDDPEVFEKANAGILDDALFLAGEADEEIEALLVWDPRLRSERDYTEHFGKQAEHREIPVKSIAILDS